MQPHGLKTSRLLCPWDSPTKNTGGGSHPLFQGIFMTQRSNQSHQHHRQILYHLNHQDSPNITVIQDYVSTTEVKEVEVTSLMKTYNIF